MRSQAALILFIAGMLVAALAVGAIVQVVRNQPTTADVTAPASSPTIQQVGVWSVSNQSAQYVTIDVAGSNTPVALNSTLVTLSMQSGTASYTLS